MYVGPLQFQWMSDLPEVADVEVSDDCEIGETANPRLAVLAVGVVLTEDRTNLGPAPDATTAWDVWGPTPAWDASVMFSDHDVVARFSLDPAFVARFSRSRTAALNVLAKAALRLSLAVAAPFAKAMLMHGAAIILPGATSATLFVGPSGAGKTTMAARLPGATVLADDTVLVWSEGGQFHVTGTPLRGRENHPTRIVASRLDRIMVLKPHAAAARLAPLEGSAAFDALLQRTFYYPSPALPPSGQGLLFDLVGQLAASVPTFELHSDLGHDVARMLARTEASHV